MNKICSACIDDISKESFCDNCKAYLSESEIKKSKDFDLRKKTKRLFKKKIDIYQIHTIIREKKQKPKYCEICNEHKEKLELASINHNYTIYSKDYMYLCRNCHSIYDKLKGLRLFNRNQKEYVWKMIYMLNLDIERYFLVKFHIYELPRCNYVELIPTKLIEYSISKRWYYYFKLNEKRIMKLIKK